VNAAEAEEYTAALVQSFSGTVRHVLWAPRNGVPEAMGLSIEEWAGKFGSRVKLSIGERRAAAAELSAGGLSQRAIAALLGVSQPTVLRDLADTNVSTDADASAGMTALADTNVSTDTNDAAAKEKAHVSRNSGDDEWYTPKEFIAAAREVLGAIDLDPASTADANVVVGATAYYTADQDGLTQPWAGRVWMNPPYKAAVVDRFCARLGREYLAGAVTAAIAIVNNATETAWFQDLCAQAAALCFPRGRVRYWHREKGSVQPLQGQVLVYLGPDPDAFAAAFRRFGVVKVYSGGEEGGWLAPSETPRNSASVAGASAPPPPTSVAAVGTW
jgi:hypothetical protein